MNIYFKKISHTDHISEWTSIGLSDEVIKSPATDNSLAPALNYVGNKIRVKFDEAFFKATQNYIYSWKNCKRMHRLCFKFKS